MKPQFKFRNTLSIIIALLFSITAFAQTATTEIFVNGACGMCAERIEDAALQVAGVQSAKWDIGTRQLSLVYDEATFNESTLHTVMASVGHDTEKAYAPPFVYDNLHGCCKYREVEHSEEDHSAENHTSGKHSEDGKKEPKEEQSNQGSAVPGPEGTHKHGDNIDCAIDHDSHKANEVCGMIYEDFGGERPEPVYGANVYWLGTTEGAVTDEDGHFVLKRNRKVDQLVVSYVGYGNDTIEMGREKLVAIVMSDAVGLDEVQITYRRKSTEISFFEPIKVQNISEKELLKAACCNLSESFETNPSVDVSFTDAVTGTRQIEMLGLAGPYVQITRENMPDIRGIAALYGFVYTPGHWIESIQLNMGTGSVVNGYESITGQINVELRKPQKSDRMYLNLYGNEGGRLEGNLNLTHKLNDNWSTSVLLHGKTMSVEHDRNNDQFLDMPLSNMIAAVNRWKWFGKKGWEGQFGVKAVVLDNRSGQKGFSKGETPTLWGAEVNNSRYEAWYKMGKVFPNKPYSSFGSQFSFSASEQESVFGLKTYDAKQNTFYANLIYQSIFKNTNHEYKTGLSFQLDDVNESLVDPQFIRNYLRTEAVPGAFFEYNYSQFEKITVVAGMRADYHNIYGLFFTPRLHARYAFHELTVLRASAGRGQRTASIIAENIGMLASNRQIFINKDNNDYPYGLDPEVGWNFGINLTQTFRFENKKELDFGVDFYHTRFDNQIVVDYDKDPQSVYFYNLDGQSYSNSLQTQLSMEIVPRFDVKVAHRFNDVQTDFEQGRLQKAFAARHRAFINLAYETPSVWKFDFTLNWQGEKRIPNTTTNPEEYRLAEFSPDFFLANAQISKTWNDKFELYLGGENLFNFRQENPILSVDEPFGEYFDASLVWGPVFGRNVYGGLRWRIE